MDLPKNRDSKPDTLDGLKAYLRRSFPGIPGVEAGTAILSALSEMQETAQFGYTDLAAMAGREIDDAQVLWAMAVLCSSNIAIFDTKLVFRDEGAEYVLEKRVMGDALADRPLTHPMTGALVENWTSKTFMVFLPNAYGIALIRGAAKENTPEKVDRIGFAS